MQQARAKCAPINNIALFTGNASTTLAQFKFMCGVDEYQLTHWKIQREVIIDKHSGSIEPPHRMGGSNLDFSPLDKLEVMIDDLRTARFVEVNRQTFGSQWPYLKFNGATIRCVQRRFGNTLRPLVTIQLGEKIYGLNGVASGVGGYADSRALMSRDDESGTYQLGATGKLIAIGLEQCRQ